MVLVGADPKRFFVPPYVGHKGWIGVRLDDKPDWDEVAELVKRSYRLVAPKRLARWWGEHPLTPSFRYGPHPLPRAGEGNARDRISGE
jgi:hypothetical protein